MNKNSQERQVARHGHLWLPWALLAIHSLFPESLHFTSWASVLAHIYLFSRDNLGSCFLEKEGPPFMKFFSFSPSSHNHISPFPPPHLILQENVFIPPPWCNQVFLQSLRAIPFISLLELNDAIVSILSHAFILFHSPSSAWKMLSFSLSSKANTHIHAQTCTHTYSQMFIKTIPTWISPTCTCIILLTSSFTKSMNS